jgi:uncharacterized protein YdcH (DUF465 family)
MFNALKYSQELEQAGFTREEAEVSVKILIEVMNDNFATKADLFATKNELKAEIDRLENRMQSGFSEIKSEMRELEYKLTIKLGVMLSVAVGATATMMKLFQAL